MTDLLGHLIKFETKGTFTELDDIPLLDIFEFMHDTLIYVIQVVSCFINMYLYMSFFESIFNK